MHVILRLFFMPFLVVAVAACAVGTQENVRNASGIEISDVCRAQLAAQSSGPVTRIKHAPPDLEGFGQPRMEVLRIGEDSLFLIRQGMDCGKLLNFGDQISATTIPNVPIYSGKVVPFGAQIEALIEETASRCKRTLKPAPPAQPNEDNDQVVVTIEPTSPCSLILLENSVQLRVKAAGKDTSIMSFYEHLFVW